MKEKCWVCGKNLKPCQVKFGDKVVDGWECTNEQCPMDKEYTTIVHAKDLKEARLQGET